MYSVTYLHHSGFLVETEHYCLIFDYYTQGGRNHFLTGDNFSGKQAVVFVSHAHNDHFDPTIFSWQKQVSSVQYILADDISSGETKGVNNVQMVHWHQTYTCEGITIETLRSTDEGVAFLVTADGVTIYHAGDLHWWHWKGEQEEINRSIGQMYTKEIDSIAGREVDVALIPVDLRLEENFLMGLDYFVKQVPVKYIFPMHFWKRFEVWEKLQQSESGKVYGEKVVHLQKKNEKFVFYDEIVTNK